MALQPEIRTDSLEGQLPDSLPATEAALSGVHLPAARSAGDDPRYLAAAPRHSRRAVRSRFDTRNRTVSGATARPIYESAPFQGIVLVLVFAYLVIIYHNLREVYVLCRKLSLDRSKPGRMTDTQGSTYARFVGGHRNRTSHAGSIDPAAGGMLVSIPEVVPEAWIPVLGLLATVGLAVLLLFQVGLLRITGYVTLSRPITDQLIALKFNYLPSVIFLCPLILLFLLASPDTGHILSFGIFILGGALLLLYLKESSCSFSRKKFRFCIGFCTFVPSKFFP